MNQELSAKLLSAIMNWNAQTADSEILRVNFISDIKYDYYDNFLPGHRFIASFAQWLRNFDEDERKVMYDFIMKNLVFITSTQMAYLVELLYMSIMKKSIIKTIQKVTKKPIYLCRKEELIFNKIKRKSLVMGLSDGAHTDILRRSAGLNNEQVLTLYYPSQEKIKEMITELKKTFLEENKPLFTSLYLIDDFTASGTSFIRYDAQNEKYKGKLPKILNQFCANPEQLPDPNVGTLRDLFESKPLDVHVCFCIATTEALSYIRNMLTKYICDKRMGGIISATVEAVQTINSIDFQKEHKEVCDILKKEKYFDSELVIKKSYKIGKHDNPYLGYNECGLTIVLSHNTPNNSLPILWQDSNSKIKGVFPRVNRH